MLTYCENLCQGGAQMQHRDSTRSGEFGADRWSPRNSNSQRPPALAAAVANSSGSAMSAQGP